MEAPISKRIREILSDPKQARELARQTMISQRSPGKGQIKYNGEVYRIVRSSEPEHRKGE